MFDWLSDSAANGHGLPLDALAQRLLVSLLFGAIVAGVYVFTQRRTRSDLMPFATTLVLLTVLISMVTLVIGNSVARAFSLAGALAIIRFRTVVEDTRDTAFVIFGVVVGMAVGAGMIYVPLIGVPIVTAAAFALSFFGNSPSAVPVNGDYALSIRLGLGRDPAALLKEVFGKHLKDVRLRATTTARQGAAIDLTYVVKMQREAEAVSFVTELNQIEGVQSVELRQM